jgi:hypothetical protein
MSHHHMLPPIVYTPQPKPKKIEPRKSRIRMHGAYGVDDTGEVTPFESGEPPAPVGQALVPENFVPVEGAERKPQQPQGRLSESTLKVMLQVQELDQAKPV